VIEGVFHAKPLRINESDETAVDLEEAYTKFERTLSNSLGDEPPRHGAAHKQPEIRDGAVDRIPPPAMKTSTSYTNTFTVSPHRSSHEVENFVGAQLETPMLTLPATATGLSEALLRRRFVTIMTYSLVAE
jgi:hypothetical protein